MRRIVAALLGVGLAISLAAAPANAGPVVDTLACSAGGSYSRIVGGVPTTYWLVATESAGGLNTRRYWHLERPRGSGLYFWYHSSYAVVCRGTQIIGSVALNGWKVTPSLCGTAPFTIGAQRYTRVGFHDSYVDEIVVATLYRYAYWRVEELDSTGWDYVSSGYARCPLT